MTDSGIVASRGTGGDRGREIVAEAARLFDAYGYGSTSMQQIADAVSIAKPTLYHYFSSKDEILFQIHEEFIDILLEKFRARRNTGVQLREELVGAMGDILSLMQTHRGHVRVFFEHHRELPDDRRREIRHKRDEYEGLVVSLLEFGQSAGLLRVQDARITALAMFGMCNWAYQWFDARGALTPEQIASQFGELLTRGLRSER